MTSHPSSGGADPGAQPQRTALAWLRTAMALAGGCALLVRVAEPKGALDDALTVLLLLSGLGAVACADARHRQVLRHPPDAGHRRSPPAFLVAGLSAATTVAGFAALLLLL